MVAMGTRGMIGESTKHTFSLKSFLIYLLMAFSSFFLPGCGSNSSEVNNTNVSKPTILVWHWMTDRQAPLAELAKRYEEKTGIKIKFELYAPSDAYSQKVRAAAQGNNLPDIFGILAEKRDFAAFIKAGHIADLTPNMNAENGKWKNYFFAKALAGNEFNEGNTYGVSAGIYGVPIDVTTIQMLYNKDLFRELGLDPQKPPATFDEFLAIGDKLKAKNMQGLVSGWGEMWMIDCLANNYAFNIMGKDKVLATLRGEVPYTDPDWVKVLSLFKKMQDSGVLANGLVTMINKTAEQLFANGKAVFAFNGSWCVNVYKGMNPNLNYGVMLPPRASDKYPMSIWGGAGTSFMVNDRSPRKEEAIKFLQWFTEKDQQVFFAEKTNNLPANKESIKNIPEILAQFSDDIEYATHPNTWGVSEFPPVIEALDKGIQSIIIGEKSPEQVSQDVQKIKERELAKKKAK
ncbi:MAG: extracellular solute-binding protein [Candidatus Omnitrophica bacterium]|nr:extracellular solute-binding protein [Candidatus Omnitrophota bacterium]